MSESILIRNDRDPLCGYTRNEFIRMLARALENRVESAWIFGSLATNQMKSSSDVDLMIIQKTEKPFLERAREFFDIMDLGPGFDILVYTPEEFERLTTNPTTGFWNTVVKEMIRIV